MTVSNKTILAEVVKRNDKIKNAKKLVLKGNFPQQDAFINDPSRFVVAQCSRRSGKTNGLVLRFFKTMEKHPKSQCLYLAHTRDSAKEIIWQVLQEHNDAHDLGCTFTESKLEMTHPNGSKLRIYGADMKDFIKRLRGRKYPGVAIDEAQDFGSHLQSLIDDVVTPSIADYADGWLAVTGTPGPVPQGYFFDITQKSRFGYSKHGWTILDNPYMPNPAKFLKELVQTREWADDNPTYRREYKNEWVLDANSLWIRYSKAVNDYQVLPTNEKFTYVMGVDIGFRDSDAIAILAYSETSPVTYLAEEFLMAKQDITALAENIKAFTQKYDISKIVMDEGGLGKKAAEEMRNRYSLPIMPADKIRKQENVELLNDSMRLGRFKAQSETRFVKDSYLVQIDWDKSTPNRIVIKKNPHSDIIDAVLYAFKESYAYAYQPPELQGPKWGSKEWADQQSTEMFEAEMEGFQRALEAEKYELGE